MTELLKWITDLYAQRGGKIGWNWVWLYNYACTINLPTTNSPASTRATNATEIEEGPEVETKKQNIADIA